MPRSSFTSGSGSGPWGLATTDTSKCNTWCVSCRSDETQRTAPVEQAFGVDEGNRFTCQTGLQSRCASALYTLPKPPHRVFQDARHVWILEDGKRFVSGPEIEHLALP